jgi:hypothetical protein
MNSDAEGVIVSDYQENSRKNANVPQGHGAWVYCTKIRYSNPETRGWLEEKHLMRCIEPGRCGSLLSVSIKFIALKISKAQNVSAVGSIGVQFKVQFWVVVGLGSTALFAPNPPIILQRGSLHRGKPKWCLLLITLITLIPGYLNGRRWKSHDQMTLCTSKYSAPNHISQNLDEFCRRNICPDWQKSAICSLSSSAVEKLK